MAAIVASFALAAVPASSADAARTVKRGAHGAAVKSLQRILHQHPDGIFGPGTARSLKRFQKRHGLTPDGVAGPATWRALRAASASKAAAAGPRVASRGSSVSTLQAKLGLPPDGVFGPQTKAAVQAFQSAHGLTADGVVGPATWAALGVGGSPPVLKARGSGASAGAGASRADLAIHRAVAAANRIDPLPYKYGGGHGSFSDSGYDCSGSVSYVLHAAGLLDTPEDSSQLMSYGASGPGRRITIYSNPGHAYMVIDGRRFDTSGNAAGRWQSEPGSTAGYVVRHPRGF